MCNMARILGCLYGWDSRSHHTAQGSIPKQVVLRSTLWPLVHRGRDHTAQGSIPRQLALGSPPWPLGGREGGRAIKKFLNLTLNNQITGISIKLSLVKFKWKTCNNVFLGNIVSLNYKTLLKKVAIQSTRSPTWCCVQMHPTWVCHSFERIQVTQAKPTATY